MPPRSCPDGGKRALACSYIYGTGILDTIEGLHVRKLAHNIKRRNLVPKIQHSVWQLPISISDMGGDAFGKYAQMFL